MNHLLVACREFKSYVHGRRLVGDLKPGGPAGTTEETQRDWLKDFIKASKGAYADVPKATFVIALQEVWEAKLYSDIATRRDWNSFSVEPRPGWKQHISKPRRKLQYSDWLQGQTRQASKPRVTVDKAVEQLFDNHYMAFRWGRVYFEAPAISAIKRLRLEERIVDYHDFFQQMELLTFRWDSKLPGVWQVRFDFAPLLEPPTEEEMTITL